MTTIISYNINGIRAGIKKGLMDWLNFVKPDIICLQETKAMKEQLDLTIFDKANYNHYWYSAEKKGYSGVAILSKVKPDHVEYGCGIEKYDREARVLRADYGDISVMSVYMPSGSSGDARQYFKMQWLEDFQEYIDELRITRPNIIISGDFNICHKAIDIHNPISNANSSGFLPEERAWVDKFISSGMVDSFRAFNQEPHHYSWWSYRQQARLKNLGWRIDYHMVSQSLNKKIKGAAIFPDVNHSDHCPIFIDMDF